MKSDRYSMKSDRCPMKSDKYLMKSDWIKATYGGGAVGTSKFRTWIASGVLSKSLDKRSTDTTSDDA